MSRKLKFLKEKLHTLNLERNKLIDRNQYIVTVTEISAWVVAVPSNFEPSSKTAAAFSQMEWFSNL